MKQNYFRKTALGLLLAVTLLLTGCFAPLAEEGGSNHRTGLDNAQTTLTPAEPAVTSPAETGSKLEVHYLDVGQGDATLLICDGEAMLIDAGENDKGTLVQNYLTHLGIKKLKYVIGTHPHSDHIGGLDVVIYKFDCETILMPDLERDMKTYQDVIDAMKIKDYTLTIPEVGDTYSLGAAQFQILAPNGSSYESINDYSIALLLTHGDNKFLFTGDAQEISEKEMLVNGLALDADVYQAGHHGSYSSTSEDFIAEVSPDYAVISCGENNDYGHPHAETLNRLRMHGVQVFRTDEQGTIVATSVIEENGTSLTWNTQSTESWQSGEQTKPQPTKEPAKTMYVLNTSSRKFHLPSCEYADTISEKNRAESTKTRKELEAEGYVACRSCLGK